MADINIPDSALGTDPNNPNDPAYQQYFALKILEYAKVCGVCKGTKVAFAQHKDTLGVICANPDCKHFEKMIFQNKGETQIEMLTRAVEAWNRREGLD